MLKFLKSKTAKTVGGLMVAGMFLFASSASAALTTSQVNAILGLLNSFGADAATVANVQASLTGGTPVVSAPSSSTTIDFGSKTLKVGSKGQYVKNLQSFLGVTADGDFGPLTKAKVMAWQSNNGLTADGLFGPASRAKANAGSSSTGGSVVVNPPVASGPVAVSLAANNPAAGSVLKGQALADLANFTFTGSGTVNQITLQRTGLSVSADVSNIYLFDGNTRLTDSASINTAGVVVFNNLNLAVNGSRTISVKADIALGASSVTLGVNLVSYVTAASATPVVVNLAGNIFTVYSQPAGMLGVSSSTAASALVVTANVNAGTMGYTVWSNSLAVSGRAGLLKGLNLHYVGSAPTDALANVKLYLDGSQIGSASTVSANGYLFFDLGSGVNLSVSTHTLSVRADIMKGSNRNFQLSLQNSSDLNITDSQIGVNVSTTNAVLRGVAGTITINPGSATVSVDPSFDTSVNITGGATNVTLAQYKITAYGEDMKISSLIVTPSIGSVSPSSSSMSNVTLYANGGQIGSSQNYTGTALTYNLGTSLIIPAGQTVIVEVRADTMNTSSVNFTGGTLSVALSGASNNAQGMSSQNLVQVPGSSKSGGTLTVGSASATVSVSTTLNSKNVVSNTAKTKIGSFVIQAGSTEGVRVTNLQVGLTFGGATTTYSSGTLTSVASASITFNSTANIAVGDVLTFASSGTAAVGTVTSITSTTVAVVNITTAGTTTFSGVVTGTTGPMTITNISNLYTSDSSSIVGNPTATNNFPVNYTIAPSTAKTIDVYADLGTLNAGTVQATLKITAVGATTNVALTSGNGIATALSGQVMTVAAGSVATPTLTTSSMVSQYIAGGTSPALATYNFVATNGDATITELKFTIATTASAASQVCIGSVCAPVISGVADIAGLNILVPAGYAGQDVLVSPTFNAVGIGQQTSNSAFTMNLTYMKYTVGNVTTAVSPTVTGNAMRLVASYPTVAINSATRSGLSNTLVKLADVTVTADTHGAIKLAALPIVTTSTGVVSVASFATALTDLTTALTQTITVTSSSGFLTGDTVTITGEANTATITSVPSSTTIAVTFGSAPSAISSVSTAVTLTARPNNITVKDGSGNILNTTYSITNASFMVAANGSSADVPIVFGTSYNIPAGTSVTFGIYATAATVSGAVNTTSLSTKLGAVAGFKFDDVSGNVTGILGSSGPILNYPTSGSVITN